MELSVDVAGENPWYKLAVTASVSDLTISSLEWKASQPSEDSTAFPQAEPIVARQLLALWGFAFSPFTKLRFLHVYLTVEQLYGIQVELSPSSQLRVRRWFCIYLKRFVPTLEEVEFFSDGHHRYIITTQRIDDLPDAVAVSVYHSGEALNTVIEKDDFMTNIGGVEWVVQKYIAAEKHHKAGLHIKATAFEHWCREILSDPKTKALPNGLQDYRMDEDDRETPGGQGHGDKLTDSDRFRVTNTRNRHEASPSPKRMYSRRSRSRSPVSPRPHDAPRNYRERSTASGSQYPSPLPHSSVSLPPKPPPVSVFNPKQSRQVGVRCALTELEKQLKMTEEGLNWWRLAERDNVLKIIERTMPHTLPTSKDSLMHSYSMLVAIAQDSDDWPNGARAIAEAKKKSKASKKRL